MLFALFLGDGMNPALDFMDPSVGLRIFVGMMVSDEMPLVAPSRGRQGRARTPGAER